MKSEDPVHEIGERGEAMTAACDVAPGVRQRDAARAEAIDRKWWFYLRGQLYCVGADRCVSHPWLH